VEKITIVFILLVVFLIIVTGLLPAVINFVITSISTIISIIPTVHQAAKEVCNIDSTVLDSVVNEIETQKPNDTKIQNIISIYRTGSKLTECDVIKLVSYLNENERKRFNLQDMVCTAVNCS